MPIYEFKCTHCHELFEILLIKSNDEVDLRCPNCSGESIERVLSRTCINAGGKDPNHSPKITERKCTGGSCQTITLPGHTK